MENFTPITSDQMNAYYAASGVTMPQIGETTRWGVIEGFGFKKSEHEALQGMKGFYSIVAVIDGKQIGMTRVTGMFFKGEDKSNFISWFSTAQTVDAFFGL